MVSLDKYKGSCNTPDDFSCRICVLNKTEDVNLHISCNCKSKSCGRKCNFNEKWNKDTIRC